MDNTLDQREALYEAGQFRLLGQPQQRGTGRSYRMMQAAVSKAAHGRFVLVICDNRHTVFELTRCIPLEVSKYLTVRCIESHPEIDWVNWKVPGWENHELFVDHMLLKQKFPQFLQMLNY